MQFILVGVEGDDLVNGTLQELKVWCKYVLPALPCYKTFDTSWVDEPTAPGLQVYSGEETELADFDTERTRVFLHQLLQVR